MKKIGVVCLLGILILQISLASAIDLDIQKKEISSTSILELMKPAEFELTIKNDEPFGGDFYLYTLVPRLDIEPKQPFKLEGNETKTIIITIYPKQNLGYYSFEYKIRDPKFNIQTENLAINVLSLKDCFKISSKNIAIDDNKAVIYLENRADHEISGIDASFSSDFFDYKESFSLGSKEKKEIQIPLDREKSKSLLAGPYMLKTKLRIESYDVSLESIIRFAEKSGLETSENVEGILIRRHEIAKINIGNIPAKEEIVMKKNILANWFTTFNVPPSNKDTVGFTTFAIFEKTLDPGQELRVIAKTNWILFISIILLIIIVSFLAIRYSNCKLKITKTAVHVKTRGGEFALKISLVLKARDFVERIRVIDKIPAMVKLYENYGPITPHKVDKNNKRIEWDIPSLNRGEERTMSYIIYSKIGVLGKFELPEAEAIYEYKGKIKESFSNKSFFVNEPGIKRI